MHDPNNIFSLKEEDEEEEIQKVKAARKKRNSMQLDLQEDDVGAAPTKVSTSAAHFSNPAHITRTDRSQPFHAEFETNNRALQSKCRVFFFAILSSVILSTKQQQLYE
eukprot:scaffold670982_cov47-Prasinocladus_malaysianus.AAC.2